MTVLNVLNTLAKTYERCHVTIKDRKNGVNYSFKMHGTNIDMSNEVFGRSLLELSIELVEKYDVSCNAGAPAECTIILEED